MRDKAPNAPVQAGKPMRMSANGLEIIVTTAIVVKSRAEDIGSEARVQNMVPATTRTGVTVSEIAASRSQSRGHILAAGDHLTNRKS